MDLEVQKIEIVHTKWMDGGKMKIKKIIQKVRSKLLTIIHGTD